MIRLLAALSVTTVLFGCSAFDDLTAAFIPPTPYPPAGTVPAALPPVQPGGPPEVRTRIALSPAALEKLGFRAEPFVPDANDLDELVRWSLKLDTEANYALQKQIMDCRADRPRCRVQPAA